MAEAARSRWWRSMFAIIAVLAVAGLAACSEDSPTVERSALTWSQLRNSTYQSVVTPGSSLTLTDGTLAEPTGEGSVPAARLADVGAFGELDQGSSIDSVVFLLEPTGPDAWTTSVAAVLNDDGQPSPAAPQLLGDNVLIRTAEIVDRQLTIRYRPLMPSSEEEGKASEVTRTYTLSDGALGLVDENAEAVAIDPPLSFRYVPEVLASPEGELITIDRALAAREIAPFVVQAEQGQRLEISIEAPFDSAILSIQGLSDEVQLVGRSAYTTAYSEDISVTQSYSVNVISVAGASTDIQIAFNLTPAQASSGEAPLPVSAPETVEDLALAVPRSAQSSVAAPGETLSALSSDAAVYIQQREPARGIAVVTARDGILYSENGDEQLETASVIKVVVMTCVMARAEQQGRYVNEWELSLMWPMITYSDNDATDVLWNDLGGGPGVAACLESLEVTGITPYDGPYWGTSTASATGFATLMARLAFGELVNPVHRAAALALLTSVIEEQRWGVPAGADESGAEVVGVKNGWYPDDDGWRVNSVGFISPLDANTEPYAIAVMTNYQSTQEYGIETIEGLALPVYEVLR